MLVKVKRKLKNTSHIENIDKFKKCFLRGERNAKCFDKILCN